MLAQDSVAQEQGRERRGLARLVFRPKRDASIWSGQGHRNVSREWHEPGCAKRSEMSHFTQNREAPIHISSERFVLMPARPHCKDLVSLETEAFRSFPKTPYAKVIFEFFGGLTQSRNQLKCGNYGLIPSSASHAS